MIERKVKILNIFLYLKLDEHNIIIYIDYILLKFI